MQAPQSVDFALGPAMFDRYVLLFDKSRFARPLVDGIQPVRLLVREAVVDESDRRHRPLLYTRGEPPRRREA
jgi:hypothetical protein